MAEIKMPVCPYCGVEMKPITMENSNGWGVDVWECDCIDIPRQPNSLLDSCESVRLALFRHQLAPMETTKACCSSLQNRTARWQSFSKVLKGMMTKERRGMADEVAT